MTQVCMCDAEIIIVNMLMYTSNLFTKYFISNNILGNTSPKGSLTQIAQARRVVDTDNISFDSHIRVWNVKGTSGTPRVVTLHPKETCSCPSSNCCYHIMAVKMVLGQTDFNEKKRINLTQLRKRSRSRKDKKSGRKKPREGDVDSELGINTYLLI